MSEPGLLVGVCVGLPQLQFPPHLLPRCPALQQGHQVPHLVIVASHLQHPLPGDGMDHHGKYAVMLAWHVTVLCR